MMNKYEEKIIKKFMDLIVHAVFSYALLNP